MGEYLAQIKAVLGTTGVIVPIADGHVGIEAADHTTITTQGDGGAHVWTYQTSGRNDWALKAVERGRGRIPWQPFGGVTTERIDTPDIDFYSRIAGDGLSDLAFSVGLWAYFKVATSKGLIAKWGANASAEWRFLLDSTSRYSASFRDPSAAVQVERRSNAGALVEVVGRLRFVGFSYDPALGTGATVMDGITLYRDGAVLPSAATNNASYVAMENSTDVPIIGCDKATDGNLQNPMNGFILGSDLGPFYTQKTLSLAEWAKLYAIGCEAQQNLGLDLHRLGRR